LQLETVVSGEGAEKSEMQNRMQGGSAYEGRLVARFQAGEPEALGALFDLYVDQVFTYARHLLGNRDDAEEVASEAFVRAFERAASFRGECPFRGWLFGITRNLCLDRLRQPRLLTLESETAAWLSDGGQQARRMETNLLVQRALEALSPEHRLALLLCDVEEWDAREAALAMERTVAATKSLLYRARRELRARMTELLELEDTEEKSDAL
jgi:RNA polymerase sigma-70 factor (ECF subfamily)